ncbi:hypothetical protein [Oceanobacillus sp. Castelsardo]
MTNIIDTSQLTKNYKSTTIVNEINISVEQGDIYEFLGGNWKLIEWIF